MQTENNQPRTTRPLLEVLRVPPQASGRDLREGEDVSSVSAMQQQIKAQAGQQAVPPKK